MYVGGKLFSNQNNKYFFTLKQNICLRQLIFINIGKEP